MSRKHFEKMAAAFAIMLDCETTPEARAGMLASVEVFCAVAASCNERFSRVRFLEACGLDGLCHYPQVR